MKTNKHEIPQSSVYMYMSEFKKSTKPETRDSRYFIFVNQVASEYRSAKIQFKFD